MAVRKHLLHLKSSALNANGDGPKTPTAQDLEYGEIAINYRDGHERLSIKNSNNEIVSFVSSEVIEENELATAAALAQLNGDIEEVAQTVEDNELAVAAALSDLDERSTTATSAITSLTTRVSTAENDIDSLETRMTTAETAIEDNEQITAAALADLDSRVMVTEQNDNLEEITYSNLVTKRTNSQLVPGKYYRITDYNTTTVQDDTQSAGHQFDVVVLALDGSTLSENAHAMLNDGDSYFSTNGADLSSWEIKYCLDNDTTRFAWADSTNGKGVIYYMKDEWNNECPYDFKNIQFKRWAITDITSSTLSGDALNELKNTYVFSSNGGKHFAAKNAYGSWIPSSQGITITVDENSFGWYYTFNGMSSENGETVNETYDVSTHHFKVTQDCIDYIINEDGSGLNTQDICFDNKVLEFMQEYIGDDLYSKGRYVLNNIVFINGLSFCYYNEDDDYWEFSTAECYGNVFKSNCNSNTFGNYVGNNTFGNNAYGNTFGNGCNRNSFGNDCWNNTFGNDCGNNTFGNNCWNNTFGNNAYDNTFGNNCRYNTFGNGCGSNTFGNYFQFNSFGNYFQSNSFGNNCGNNTLGNDCWNNTFGNNAYGNTFGNSCGDNTFGNAVNHVTFSKDYTYYVIVENGNQYITLTSTETTTSSNLLRNITIAQGVNNTTTNKSISHNTVNDAIKTTYQPANSVVNNI